jgi:hypothetical protein
MEESREVEEMSQRTSDQVHVEHNLEIAMQQLQIQEKELAEMSKLESKSDFYNQMTELLNRYERTWREQSGRVQALISFYQNEIQYIA